ncbi:MAG: phosphoribosylformylglycinamidine synthase subunit PurL [Candidatus Zixiibacteriota bacterium]|nr:MAG: phosphoribosylformylglycinamidine synthase subunit PurL [candidate division Zixibacteria bacterium]
MSAKFKQPKVTAEMVANHGLNKEEYRKIKEILGREPNFTELGIFSVMWSEHCSYKNSIALLKTLPREGEALLTGAGEENAGAVDIGHGLAVVFKIESHNHPSAIEPYQGAATGVGGILRDIFTMGARPIASLNSLHFGSPDNPRVRYLVDGVVRGIGDYGNSFGVPTVAGEVFFDEAYTANPIINAMAVGIVKHSDLATATAAGEGNPIMIVGSKTGRDGIHGATFASEELSDASQERRPAVQIGDPFTEKLLLEATLEIIRQDLIVGIQDMGAAGITCSSTEMSARGESGIEIHIDKVPVRETGMTPYEILLSESQERMLVCVKKGCEERVQAIFDKWGLDSTIVGHVTSDKMMTVKLHGEVISRIPSWDLVLGGGVPVYHRETKRPAYLDELAKLNLTDYDLSRDWNDVLTTMLASPNLCYKGWVFEQYDSMVRTNTAVGPGSDAAVLRIRKTDKALAMSTDCNGRYCYLNPRRGARIAVAEAARNIVCSGGRPLAITNCLNFGNPYKPEIYYTFSEAVKGMGEACRVFNTPVTGGNVSFYNEDPARAVFPTPTIGMIGLVEHISHITTQWFKDDGDIIFLLGNTKEELGASEYLKVIHGHTKGDIPDIDLAEEKKTQDALLSAIQAGLVKSAHDVADGGLATALAECCITNRIHVRGASIEAGSTLRPDCLLFGESQSRVIVTASPDNSDKIESHFTQAGVAIKRIGSVGGSRLEIDDLIDVSLDNLIDAYYLAMDRFMEKIETAPVTT